MKIKFYNERITNKEAREVNKKCRKKFCSYDTFLFFTEKRTMIR